MDQDQLRFDIAALLEQRQRTIDLAHASLCREHELFMYWQDDPTNETKRQLWLKQKKISEEAVNVFDHANTRYVKACVKMLPELERGASQTS
ncbi:MAG TPA: hypothetical protein VKX49_13085 [Bryobacteraceae bacterium]|nr:hypothetical protein [Bryobacteraceae bacterium]